MVAPQIDGQFTRPVQISQTGKLNPLERSPWYSLSVQFVTACNFDWTLVAERDGLTVNRCRHGPRREVGVIGRYSARTPSPSPWSAPVLLRLLQAIPEAFRVVREAGALSGSTPNCMNLDTRLPMPALTPHHDRYSRRSWAGGLVVMTRRPIGVRFPRHVDSL